MIPPLIVAEALERGLDALAISDHNASANIEAVMSAAKGTGLKIIPAMELQTAEEVHVLCLFDELDQVYALQKQVDKSLLEQNTIDFFGEQFLVDANGGFLAREDRLLLTSTDLQMNDAFRLVTELGGLFIPAHVNRKAFGLFQVLGFLPTDIPLEILEINCQISLETARQLYPEVAGMGVIQSGDAHFLEDIMGLNCITSEQITIADIRKAVLHQDGRKHRLLPRL